MASRSIRQQTIEIRFIALLLRRLPFPFHPPPRARTASCTDPRAAEEALGSAGSPGHGCAQAPATHLRTRLLRFDSCGTWLSLCSHCANRLPSLLPFSARGRVRAKTFIWRGTKFRGLQAKCRLAACNNLLTWRIDAGHVRLWESSTEPPAAAAKGRGFSTCLGVDVRYNESGR